MGTAASIDDEPDLTPLLPVTGAPNTRWVDTRAIPGRVLYRFDTVILNQGAGAFEVYRDARGTTFQRVWGGGEPPGTGGPKSFPGGGSPEDRAIAAGGPGQDNALRYSPAYGHEHFHSQRIAAYQLATQDGTTLVEASKNLAGFCLYDSWGNGPATQYYPGDYGGGVRPCAYQESSYRGLLRMGISPGWGDFYGSQLWDQWVDVTAVTPGVYRLRATVDPAGIYEESDEGNNTTEDPSVVIPGVVARPARASTPADTPVAVPLGATLVGAEVKSRKPTCPDEQTYQADCMTTAAPGVVTLAVAQPAPGRGSVSLSGTTATYTPPDGFQGAVTFSYTGTDSRGLASAPATVTVTVGSPAAGGARGGGGGGGSAPARFTLSAGQLLINQRIGQAAIRRLAAVEARLDGRPAPRFPGSGKGAGRVELSAGQLLINQRIYQAAIRRAASLEARLDGRRAPASGRGRGGTVTLSVRQLKVNQRIAQAAVRRANALQTRAGL
ncbi:MAG: lysyl oxidase family protein [Thermoleophilia bacterium]